MEKGHDEGDGVFFLSYFFFGKGLLGDRSVLLLMDASSFHYIS